MLAIEKDLQLFKMFRITHQRTNAQFTVEQTCEGDVIPCKLPPERS